MRSSFRILILFGTLNPLTIKAEELLPASKPIPEVVDHYVQALQKEEGVTPTDIINDGQYLRRVMLDLLGRIPTLTEQQTFSNSQDPNKRQQLVDRLLNSPAFLRHQVRELDRILMDGTKGSLREYLTLALKDNRSWDRIFRELMLPDQKNDSQKGSVEFLKQRVRDVDLMTNQISVVFFGVNVSCAKCHDHPLVEDWKQDHFYGMKSFLNRTFDNGGFLGEREYGEVKFKTTKGQDKDAKLMFLTGRVVEDPYADRKLSKEDKQKEKKLLESYRKKKQPPPAPKFSTRAKLVELALQPDQRQFFSKAIVNRIWYRLFGRGLVMPLDQMHSANPPSHPQLLEWLARDFAEHGYNLKRLIRGLVLSDAYARSSRWTDGDVPPAQYLFAMGQVRALTPMQLSTSLQVAITDPKRYERMKLDETERFIEGLENRARGIASEIEAPTEDFQIGVGEALLFNNSERVQRDLLNNGGDRLLNRLKDIKDDREFIQLAFKNALCREPNAEEVKLLGEFLASRKDKREEAAKHMLWALLSGAEMRFNH